MKTPLLLICTTLFCIASLSAQETVYETVYFNGGSFENDVVKVEIDNVVSLPKETKFRMRITNKTADFIIYNSEESNFEIPDQDVRAKEKSWMLDPFDSKSKTMRAFGEDLNSIREFDFVCEGFYHLVPQDAFEVNEFRLPPSANAFEAGPMHVVLGKDKRSTGGSKLKFDVTYAGQNYGMIYPHKIKVLMPDGNLYATTETNTTPIIVERGENDKFSASWDRMPGGKVNDMQKVEMLVQFEGVFLEAIPEKVDGETINLSWDESLTKEKN